MPARNPSSNLGSVSPNPQPQNPQGLKLTRPWGFWLRTQSAANPSLSEFPDHPRFTGKKREKTGKRFLRVGYSHALPIIYGRIPYAMEQGILDNDQGMRTREQGMHLLVQGIAHWLAKQGATQDRPNSRHCPSIELATLTGNRSNGFHQGQRSSHRTEKPDT